MSSPAAPRLSADNPYARFVKVAPDNPYARFVAAPPPGSGAETPASGTPRLSEGAIIRQDDKRYQMRGGQLVEMGAAPPAPAAASTPASMPAPAEPAPIDPPRQIDPNAQLPVWRGFASIPSWSVREPLSHEEWARQKGIDGPAQTAATQFGEIMARKSPDPWTAASDAVANAAVSGVGSVISNLTRGAPMESDSPVLPNTAPATPPTYAQEPVFRGLPKLPSWSENARQRYPARQRQPTLDGDR